MRRWINFVFTISDNQLVGYASLAACRDAFPRGGFTLRKQAFLFEEVIEIRSDVLRLHRVTLASVVQSCSDSVVTGLASPFSAAMTACQERMAHFTRAGYLCTPANTANLPTPSAT